MSSLYHRVAFVPASCAVALAACLSLHCSAQVRRDPIRLTHGPMLGMPSHDSVRVWARTSDPGEFVVHYGTNPLQLNKTSAAGTTTIEHDNTGVIELKDLNADTRYHYQVWVNDRPHGLPGTFRTLPSERESRAPAA